MLFCFKLLISLGAQAGKCIRTQERLLQLLLNVSRSEHYTPAEMATAATEEAYTVGMALIEEEKQRLRHYHYKERYLFLFLYQSHANCISFRGWL